MATTTLVRDCTPPTRRRRDVLAREKDIRATCYASYRPLIARATAADWVAAAEWYAEAQAMARDIATSAGLTLEQSAAIVAVLSPRVTWAQNVRLATTLAHGGDIVGLSDATDKARAILADASDPFAYVRGPKVQRFCANILGDMDYVTVDVWMLKASRLNVTRDSHGDLAPTTVQYRAIESAVRYLAREYNVTPAVLQALIWIVVRGRAD